MSVSINRGEINGKSNNQMYALWKRVQGEHEGERCVSRMWVIRLHGETASLKGGETNGWRIPNRYILQNR